MRARRTRIRKRPHTAMHTTAYANAYRQARIGIRTHAGIHIDTRAAHSDRHTTAYANAYRSTRTHLQVHQHRVAAGGLEAPHGPDRVEKGEHGSEVFPLRRVRSLDTTGAPEHQRGEKKKIVSFWMIFVRISEFQNFRMHLVNSTRLRRQQRYPHIHKKKMARAYGNAYRHARPQSTYH